MRDLIKKIREKIKNHSDIYGKNEQAVRTQLIEPILNQLGWETSDPAFVRPNLPTEDGKIPDYTLIKDGKSKLFFEAKNTSIDLEQKGIIKQLSTYCYENGLNFGVLSNGTKWLLFKTLEQNPKDRVVWQIDIVADELEQIINKLKLISYDNIDILDFQLKQEKILDDTWTKVIKSDHDIVQIITDKIIGIIRKDNPNIKINIDDVKKYISKKLSINIANNLNISIVERNSSNELLNTNIDNINSKNSKSNNHQKIRVIFPDKTVFEGNNVTKTYINTITKIGIENVKSLKLTRSNVPLISETKDLKYTQKFESKFWVFTNLSTSDKLKTIEEINRKLNLGLVINPYYI